MADSGAPPVPGGRQRGRPSRDYSAALSPEHYADQVLATLYHTHYYSLLVRIAALLTGDTTAAERMVEDAFVSVQHARRHLRDQDDSLSYLRRLVVSSARSQRAASPDLLRCYGLAVRAVLAGIVRWGAGPGGGLRRGLDVGGGERR